jgi:hypothetical protein
MDDSIMDDQTKSDPWVEAAKGFKAQPQSESAPAGNDDWKVWQANPENAPQGNTGFFGPIQDAYDAFEAPQTPEQRMSSGKVGAGIADFARGVGEIAQPLMHPVKTAMAAMPHSIPEAAEDVIDPGARALSGMASGVKRDFKENGAGEAIPHLMGQVAGGYMAGEMPGAVSDAAGAVHEAAMGDPDAAALRGLQVGPKSPKTLRTLSAVEGARPFLKGATDMADLQGRIPAAKGEIWSPYNDALAAVGDKPVKGPDGTTTVRGLEEERQQLSALNRGLKANSPEAIQLAQQKGMTAAQLLDRERAVQGALDPELAKTGIDPLAIRKAFGQVSEVGGRVSGKSTLIEKPQPSGFGKIGQMSLERPLQAPGQVFSGIRDLAAGRPFFEAKPTDLGIKEGFRTGGPKPDFGRVTTTGMAAPPRALLPAAARSMPAPAYDGTVQGYRPPPVAPDTTPMRLNRLLPAATRDTRLPMSSYHEQFPEQLPNSQIIDFIHRSK